MDAMINAEEWVNFHDEYLPEVIRKDENQRYAFISYMEGEVGTEIVQHMTDVLRFFALHGYTLQKTRKRVKYKDLAKAIAKGGVG